MENPVLGEWLVLFLLFLNCSRIFFLKYGKVDSLAFLAPLCVVFSVLHIFAWGADIFSVTILVISIFAFFTNFRALLRFSSGLFIDHYSILFKIGAIVILVFTILVSALLIYFRPVFFNASEFGAEQKIIRLFGDFTNGFSKAYPFEFAQGEVLKIYPEPEEESNGQSIIIVPDKTANVLDYKILAYKLVEKGYTVYIGEFHARDGKWCRNLADMKIVRCAYLLMSYFRERQKFDNQLQFYTFNIEKECGAMLEFVLGEQGDEKTPVCFVGDWMSQIALPEFVAKNRENVAVHLNLCDFEEYKTPRLGFVQYTAPVILAKAGIEKEKGFASVDAIAARIMEAFPPLEKPEVPAEAEKPEAQEEQNDVE